MKIEDGDRHANCQPFLFLLLTVHFSRNARVVVKNYSAYS